jgi:tRNA(Ile)-lysidine synthase
MNRAARKIDRQTLRVVNSVRDVLLSKRIQNEPLVVAVSGGADSMALLTALAALRGPLELQLHVAHFDHRLRPDSVDDARWLEEHCRRKGFDFTGGASDSPPPKTHVEAWARTARYAFLGSVARRVGARWIAVAHTANDQAETVLHHVLRGTGLKGAAGIPMTRRLRSGARLIRPCLMLTRRELLECLEEQGVSFRNDPSNNDPRFTRNRLRHCLLPMIEEHFNPKASQALYRLAEQSQAVAQLVRRQARKLLYSAILEKSETQIRLTSEPFVRRNTVVVQEAAVVLWTRLHWPRVGMSSAHWKRVGQLLRGKGATRIELPGGVIGVRRGGLVSFERSSGPSSAD